MIAIVNISTDDAPMQGINQYQVKINEKVICEFDHDRKFGGLADCLRDAANAVDAESLTVTEHADEETLKKIAQKLWDDNKKFFERGANT